MPLDVWYLDDEPDLCEIFFEIFSSEDIQITVFTEPSKLLEAAKSKRPDVLFVDFRLPATTGDKIAQSLDKSIPKYLITGDLAVVTTYEFNQVFTKPYVIDEVQKVLNKHKK